MSQSQKHFLHRKGSSGDPQFNHQLKKKKRIMKLKIKGEEDSLPPLPNIQPSFVRSISEERMKMDGRESPEMKQRKAAEANIDKTAVPLSKAPASPLRPPSSPEKADVRLFAL